eukprot:gene40601-54895_t
MLPPLNPLHVFDVAARHLSFTRAAAELRVTQPAISRQITTLESFLGIRLFERDKIIAVPVGDPVGAEAHGEGRRHQGLTDRAGRELLFPLRDSRGLGRRNHHDRQGRDLEFGELGRQHGLAAVAGETVQLFGETDPRPQTTSPTFDALNFPAMELYAMPAATANLLEDAAVDLDSWLASEIDQVFAVQEGTAFVSGDGVNKPKGFLSYTTVAQSSWAWGSMGYIASGAAGAFAASNPSDVLIDLIYALRAGYRQNAHFIMNRKTQALVR